MKYKSDGLTNNIKVQEDGSITITAAGGYDCLVDVLCELKDNGSGYYVKIKSYSCTEPDHIFNLDYSEIEYIYMAYKALKKKEKKNAPKD